MNYKSEIENLLFKLPHQLQVQFAYNCANDVKHLSNNAESAKCLELVAKWLADENSVSKDELYEAAAYATYAAAANAATYAVTYAAAAYAAYAAAATTAYAAAAYAAAVANSDIKFKQYYNDLINMINNLDELSKLLYGISKKKLKLIA